jgi:hypothetical protein
MKLIKDLGLRDSKYLRNGKYRRFSWGLYECPYCKIHFEYQKGKMKGSAPKSCGCLSGEKHGDWKSSLYGIWKSMKQRCRLESSTAYKYYGAKGVDVCNEWYDSYTVFKTWAISNGYKEGLSIDRIDHNSNYCPSNCRWTTRNVQARNTRILRSTNTSGYRGVSWIKRDQRFYASIGVNSKTISLGTYLTALEAAKAYDTYVITNNLEHTINGVLHEPVQSKGTT